MNVQNWRNGTITSVVAVLALVSTALIVGASIDDSTPDTTNPPPDYSELIALLTVDTTTVNCAELVGEGVAETLEDGRKIIPFDIGALKPVGESGRKWSDALSTPLHSDQSPDALKEIQTAICLDPLLGSTVAHLFAHMVVGGVKIVDINDWLKPFEVDANQINDLAGQFIPLLDTPSPNNEQITTAISQNLVYQGVAEKLGTLLSRFSVVGIQAEISVQNYHLAAAGLVVGNLPEVELNSTQEELPALVLEVNVKPGICLARIGFNTGDKRPEIFGCPEITNPPTTSSPPTGGSTTLPPPGSTTLPPPPSTTVPGGKDATQSPPQDPVVTCPSGQYADRDSGQCVSNSTTTTTIYNNSGGDSGPGAPGSGVTTPTTDPAPDPTVPTDTTNGDGYLPDPGV